MKNLMKKKLLPSAVSVVLAAGIGFSGGVQAIHLSEDGIGQVLLAPMFLAEYGSKSKFEIINTNPNTAVKVKVILRSHVSSQELLDFICYMTPSDVCRFELVKACGTIPDPRFPIPEPVLPFPSTSCPDEQQFVFMRSNDDSIKSPVKAGEVGSDKLVSSLENTAATFASVKEVIRGLLVPAKLAHQALNDPNMTDSQRLGHVEIVGVYGVQNGVTTGLVGGRNASNNLTYINVHEGMSKFSLAQIFDTPRTARDITTLMRPNPTPLEDRSSRYNAPYESEEREASLTNLGHLHLSRIRSTDPEWVRLTGNAEITFESGGRMLDRMAYRIPALAGSIGDSAVPVVSFEPPVVLQYHPTTRQPVPTATYARNLPAQLFSSSVPYGLPTSIFREVTANDTDAYEPNIINSIAPFDGLVISNYEHDTSVGDESGIGNNFGMLRLTKVLEIEAALAATHLQAGYHDDARATPPGPNRTNLVVTFPTRYLRKDADFCVTNANAGARGQFYPPFYSGGEIRYELRAYDDFENSQSISGLPFSPRLEIANPPLVEVNYFIPEWPTTRAGMEGSIGDFRKGWFNMRFDTRNRRVRDSVTFDNCPYQGVAVLAMAHRYTDYGDGFSNSQLLPVSHQPIRECGNVRYGDGVNPLCMTQRQDYPATVVELGVTNSNPNNTDWTRFHNADDL